MVLVRGRLIPQGPISNRDKKHRLPANAAGDSEQQRIWPHPDDEPAPLSAGQYIANEDHASRKIEREKKRACRNGRPGSSFT
jgi:hypothetical protein